MHEGYYPQVTV